MPVFLFFWDFWQFYNIFLSLAFLFPKTGTTSNIYIRVHIFISKVSKQCFSSCFLEIFRSRAPLRFSFSVRPSIQPSVHPNLRGRTMHIVQKLIEITLPNFICKFTGQLLTYFFTLWPITSKVNLTFEAKTKVSESNNSKTMQDIIPKFCMWFHWSIFQTFYELY